jgi:hypothetical protein
MKKQSSIEYLEQFFNSHCNPSVCDIEYSDYKIAFEQAKEMEKQKDAKYNEILEMLKYFVENNMLSAHGDELAEKLIKEATQI